MKISLLQIQPQLGDAAHNQKTVRRLAELALKQKPDVLALPEMWNIGFYPKPLSEYADINGSATQAFLSQLARQYSVNIVGGSAAICVDGRFYNTNYVFDRDGQLLSTYNKTHLFSMAKEDRVFTAGDKITSFKLDGIKCAVVICYDIRFGELVRTLALDDVAVLFVPAAWPIERLDHWLLLNTVRSIENQIFIAAVNGCGMLNKFHLAGHSRLLNPWGETIAAAESAETVVTGSIDLGQRQVIRETMPVFKDRRPELYKI